MNEEELVRETLTALRANGFKTLLAKNREEAKKMVLELISPEESVGVGGSITIREMGLLESLEARGTKVVHHWVKGLSSQEVRDLMSKETQADVFLTSSNAITRDGKLVNKDMTGNRVSAMIFGPQKVIVIAGVNKIVTDLTEAMERIEKVAAPLNAKRIGAKTPCATTGTCSACNSPDRICRVTTIIDKCPSKTDMAVMLVNEKLGY